MNLKEHTRIANKPMRLNKGDVIGIVSPSSSLPSAVPHRMERGIRALESLGYRVKYSKHALGNRGYLSARPQERADDLHSFFADVEVKAIMCAIGGLHYNQLLPFLDFNFIRNNPKIFIGYSDATVLHLAFFTACGFPTFYGPALLTQFGEFPSPFQYTIDFLLKAVSTDQPIGKITAAPQWTDETLDWLAKSDLVRPRILKQNPGAKWIRRGEACGPLIGGCLPSLLHLRGTPYFPNLTGCILFLELPEGHKFAEGYPLPYVEMDLADLRISGVFDAISAMVIGRPFAYSEKMLAKFEEILLETLADYDFPILSNLDFGHCDPMITIPVGAQCRISSSYGLFSIEESGVR